jgi:hypothetical protein
MFEVGNSVIDSVEDAVSPTASDLPALISKVQEARLSPKQEATLRPEQSTLAGDGATSSRSSRLHAFGRTAFKGPPLDGANVGP